MHSMLKEGAAEAAGKHSVLLSPPRRGNPLRLRGKGPSWFGLVLFFLAVDLVLAAAAWNAVDFFRH